MNRRLALKCVTLLLLSPLVAAQQPEVSPWNAAWDAAMARKSKADYRGAAAAFEALNQQFPDSPRAIEALVEAGVCWFSDARSKLDRHVVTDAARASFEASLARFDGVTTAHATSPLSSRAQYMKGSVRLFMGELEASHAAYDAVLTTHTLDHGYVGKALERRAAVSRHLLRPRDALADMQRWMEEFRSPPVTLEVVEKQLALTRALDKPAPRYVAETWIQGEPSPLELSGGYVVALYFFATWCPNCAKETPYISGLEQRYAKRGLRVIGVMDHSKGQTHESVSAHLVANAIPFRVMMDHGEAARAYGATSVPFVSLIDFEGNLRWSDNPGSLAEWTVEALLDGQPMQPESESKPEQK